ncbi:hypothetical protein CMO88_01035 [Candidatus Woesearchaeota archaeon]|nr:hypothetical protein [Candidatus Woesearchaeota archaeon]
MKLKISNKHFAIAGLAVVLATAFYHFQLTGLRTLAAMAIFFSLPFYLILGRFNIENDERIFFSFFIGLGLFSTTVFYVGRVVPSYRLSIAAAFIVLLLVFVFLKRIKKN